MRKIEVLSTCCDDKVSFGILIKDENYEKQYNNLSYDKEKIEQLKRNLEDSDISAVHIADIIKDFITEDACDKLIANSLL